MSNSVREKRQGVIES